SGTAGTTGAAGTSGAAGTTGTAGTSGTAGTMGVSIHGCSDGSREGFLDTTKYPSVAACSGAWDEPGLSSTASRVPKCNRHAGNDGERPTGGGCSAADLCAVGWRVCENADVLAGISGGCNDAIAPFADSRVFFVTRQHSNGIVCSATAQGANNVYGCGNFGGTSDHSCNPLTRLLRDSDCDNNAPWSCSSGTLGMDFNELDQIVKGGPLHGGVLCCKD
ncbi:MAG: Type fimbrial biosis protein PilY1, partial [Myxococcales bacterium]|nr:Type fimbrial biosis protein PilY1 [Myxococcales bacterium]